LFHALFEHGKVVFVKTVGGGPEDAFDSIVRDCGQLTSKHARERLSRGHGKEFFCPGESFELRFGIGR
jgi:hypothetical protein